LAAGYLWLVTAWLLLHERVDTGSDASGAVSALSELRDAIGLGGVAAAATFVASPYGSVRLSGRVYGQKRGARIVHHGKPSLRLEKLARSE